MGADIADYNNDGLPDIAQVDMTPEDNRRAKANMSSMNPRGFQRMVDAGLHHQYMQNCLQLNRGNDDGGNPQFSEVSRLAGISTTDWSWAILFCDLDNDGWQDLLISNGTRRDINNRDYFLELKSRNKFGGVAFTQEEIDRIPSEKISNYVYRNNGDLTFTNVVKDWGVDQRTFSNGATYADLDNDGDLDYVVNNIDEPAAIYRNNNTGGNNHLSVALRGTDTNTLGLGAKVRIEAGGQTQWRELTLTRGFQSSVSPVLHFGLGQAVVVDLVEVHWPDGRRTTLHDVAANQRLTLSIDEATTAPSTDPAPAPPQIVTAAAEFRGIDFRHQENEYNDYHKEPLLPYATSKLGGAVAVADVNGDGREDVFYGGASGQAGAVYLQDAEGNFTKAPAEWAAADAAHEDMSALFFDADGDGDPDLYVVSGGNEHQKQPRLFQDRLYLNDGGGGFQRAANALPQMTGSGSRAVAGDFDADGDLDLFVGGKLTPGQYPWPARSYLLENDGGKFRDRTADLAPEVERLGMINDASWSDFDGDGALDLVLVGEWTPIVFLKNSGDRFVNVTAQTGLTATEGWWSALTATDFDGDGDTDYFVGNLGLNYKYQASPEAPFEVFADDFDGNGSKDIVLSYYNFGKLFPVRGRSCSSQQIPSLKKKFAGYDAFAASEVTDIYGEEELRTAEIHYRARTFASVYLENAGGGSFDLRELPRPTQFSSVNRILVEDFDGDGIQDALLAGNLFAAEIETPRNDSGMGTLLRGTGGGTMVAVPNHDIGLYLGGDVKDMALLRLDDHLAVTTARNDERPGLAVFRRAASR